MDDDLKAVGTLASVFEIAATNGERLDGWTPRELLFYAKSLRTLLSALRQRDEALTEVELILGGPEWPSRRAEARDIIRAILTGSETNAR